MAHTFEDQQERARIIVTALKGAKAFLRGPDGPPVQTCFVCIAVSHWYCSRDMEPHCREAMTVRDYVSRAIDYFGTFECWLQGQGHFHVRNVQALRHAWVDKMIADLTATYKL